MAKRMQWKKLMGLEGTSARIYKDKRAYGYHLKVVHHPLSGGLDTPRWTGWTRPQALAVEKLLQDAGIPAKLANTLQSTYHAFATFEVRDNERTVALNKLTDKERLLLGL